MIKRFEDEYLRLTIAFILITIGVIGRLYLGNILPDTPSLSFTINGITQPVFMMDLFFIIAVIAVISGLLLGGIYTFIVPLSIMAITDVIIGNSYIFLFTWSGFALIALIGCILKNKNSLKIKKTPSILGFSILGVLLYDIWTNFGCWIVQYPHNFKGLTLCYTVALPFMFWHLLSTTLLLTIIIIPLLVLKDKKMLHFNYTVKPIENHITTIFISLLVFFAVFTTLL